MSGTSRHNDQIPTDPRHALLTLFALAYTASQITPDQAQAITAAGGLAELALYALRLLHDRR
ncbi:MULTISPECIES: hypothetical protein [unclassified Streptomyces]|uniref:hypothetical protein n=1 Tax=unclassified Streptomyces TaxID=2593676 RepID=UPI001F381C07|nr:MULTISPECIES: hypothetical protein [unclassified Streptomyces]MCF0086690.1 hypothetical protein [Streptomyces sp. MH192]MCF0098844.1 hypothetical protein [Streptomyces sp. MH191]